MTSSSSSDELLEAEVERLRSVLNDPLRISQVSGSTFPLRVWERMFAVDRERKGSRHQQQHQNQNQREGSCLTLSEEEGGTAGDHQSVHSASRRSNSPTTTIKSSSAHSSSLFIGGSSSSSLWKRKPPEVRNCRGESSSTSTVPILNPKLMRDLVRSTLRGEEKDSEAIAGLLQEKHEQIAATDENVSDKIDDDKRDNNNKGRNLFAGFISSKSREALSTDQTPIAMLSCVSVPETVTTSTPTKTANGKNNHSASYHNDMMMKHGGSGVTLPCALAPNNNNTNLSNYGSSASLLIAHNSSASLVSKPTPIMKKDSSVSSVMMMLPTTTMTNNNSSTSGSNTTTTHQDQIGSSQQQHEEKFRNEPIRPFAPVSSFWGPAGGNTVIAAEQRKQFNRLEALKKPAVERHDLPFEVTEQNDFRNLPYPLTGMRHAVPYEELQGEQKYLMQQTIKK